MLRRAKKANMTAFERAFHAIIALEPSLLEKRAVDAPQNILRRGARLELLSMLCTTLVASCAADLSAFRDL